MTHPFIFSPGRTSTVPSAHWTSHHYCGAHSRIKRSVPEVPVQLNTICWRAPRPSLPADFAGYPPFHLDDVGRTGEPEAPQNSLPAFQLVHLQDGPSFLQLPLGCPDICCNLKHTHTHTRTVTPCNLHLTLPWRCTFKVSRQDKSLKRTQRTASCSVHEVSSDTTPSVPKWKICSVCQRAFFCLLISP